QFSPDDQFVFTGSHDHQAKLWNIGGYEELRILRARTLEGHTDAVLSASFSDDGKKIVTASRDRTARTWDVVTGQPLQRFEEGHEFLASSAVYSRDGQRLFTAAVDNTARVWDAAAGTEIFKLEHTGRSAALAVSRDARWILTGSDGR